MSNLASGDKWEIHAEGESFVINLHSIYGTVTLKLLGWQGRKMAKDILDTYNELYVQGPVQKEEESQ